jgi:hypothetical protein
MTYIIKTGLMRKKYKKFLKKKKNFLFLHTKNNQFNFKILKTKIKNNLKIKK